MIRKTKNILKNHKMFHGKIMYWQVDIKYLTDIDNLKLYFNKNKVVHFNH